MHFHQNHSWCSSSNWDGGEYSSSYMVDIEKFPRYKHKEVDWHDPTNCEADWVNLLDFSDHFSQEEYENNMRIYDKPNIGLGIEFIKEISFKRNMPTPKAEVMGWLDTEVKPQKDGTPGWCMGSEDYRCGGASNQFVLWFYRRKDAMAFIKRWSSHGKPTTYLNYFKDDDYRELIDGKLIAFDRSKRVR